MFIQFVAEVCALYTHKKFSNRYVIDREVPVV